MSIKSIRTKIALAAGLCLFITSGAIVVYNIYSSTSSLKVVSIQASELVKEETVGKLRSTAVKSAQSISLKMEQALTLANTIAVNTAALKYYDMFQNYQSLSRRFLMTFF